MIEMIIAPHGEEYEAGACYIIPISDSGKYIRRASYYIYGEAGISYGPEGPCKIYKAMKIRHEKPIKK